MQVKIDRKWRKPTYTIGIVYIDDERFCESMEDTDRGLRQDMSVGEISRIKVAGETAIPTGKYKVAMTYSPRYNRMMPQIMNVKGFAGIRIHSGNTAKDSLGCVLLGVATNPDKKEWIGDSRNTCKKFEELLNKAGGTCDLEII